MELKPRIKEFIEQYIHLIENNQFTELYREAEKYLANSEIHLLTECLIHPDVNLQVLSNMNYVPRYYLSTNTDITAIEIPDSIDLISTRSFDKCINLKEVILPESVTVVDGYAFSNCYSLTKLVVKNPKTMFSVLSTALSDRVEVYCKPGSEVERYANEVWYYPVHHI